MTPEVANHTNVQPIFDVYANVQGRDLGSVAARDQQGRWPSIAPKLPPGNTITMRGQVESMESAFLRLGLGLVFAAVLVYLLMVVNFQSWLDPFIIITALPGALVGIVWSLFLLADDVQRAGPDGRDHVRSASRRRTASCWSRSPTSSGAKASRAFEAALGSGPHAHAAGADDRAGDDHRHAADVAGPGRRRRAERPARPRRHRRPAPRHARTLLFVPVVYSLLRRGRRRPRRRKGRPSNWRRSHEPQLPIARPPPVEVPPVETPNLRRATSACRCRGLALERPGGRHTSCGA